MRDRFKIEIEIEIKDSSPRSKLVSMARVIYMSDGCTSSDPIFISSHSLLEQELFLENIEAIEDEGAYFVIKKKKYSKWKPLLRELRKIIVEYFEAPQTVKIIRT